MKFHKFYMSYHKTSLLKRKASLEKELENGSFIVKYCLFFNLAL
ncbi:hypothetical protein BSM4216_1744 [Bacillus smithii]|nr:hypothetical protein BSM4216_1744 [Bacillus smithii]